MSPLTHGSGCYVPREVAECPECGGELHARAMQWDAETGVPDAESIDLDCIADRACRHRWWQSDWQPVLDKIRKWSGAK